MSSFSAATTVKQLSPHTYIGSFPEHWCIGSVPHGGYVTSAFLSVVSLHFSTTLRAQNQPHTITLHLTFIRRTSVGPAAFTVYDTKLGRQTSTVRVTLTQGASAHEEVVGYITNSNMGTESGLTLPTTWSLAPPPYPVADLARLAIDEDEHWKLEKQLPFAMFRKASQHLHFYFPRKGQLAKGIIDEWIRFSNGERFTNHSLGFVADMWPQMVEAYLAHSSNKWEPASPAVTEQSTKMKSDKWSHFWYPTLLLNLEIKKALPSDGVEWLFVRVSSKQIQNGRMDLEVVILDELREIVALSQHVTLIVSVERNTAERRGTML
ncbi:HotDog domain [Lasallia pustulata]|uniref:HotDog domain n=1 Tax=Lasallia pustulata TaxID=136370 RepID=A0A1W5CRK4_9LECA|nr:HotDog domain [Lasallia pustulata]